jgi:hypothetical protein
MLLHKIQRIMAISSEIAFSTRLLIDILSSFAPCQIIINGTTLLLEAEGQAEAILAVEKGDIYSTPGMGSNLPRRPIKPWQYRRR